MCANFNHVICLATLENTSLFEPTLSRRTSHGNRINPRPIPTHLSKAEHTIYLHHLFTPYTIDHVTCLAILETLAYSKLCLYMYVCTSRFTCTHVRNNETGPTYLHPIPTHLSKVELTPTHWKSSAYVVPIPLPIRADICTGIRPVTPHSHTPV